MGRIFDLALLARQPYMHARRCSALQVLAAMALSPQRAPDCALLHPGYDMLPPIYADPTRTKARLRGPWWSLQVLHPPLIRQPASRR